jgi:anti-sigma factor RsiW
VSHLEEQISALVDGELTGAELDRANAHLAACARCREEAAELRQLKRQLRALAAPWDPPADGAFRAPAAPGGSAGQRSISADEALTRRLLAMAGPGGPVPSRGFRREQFRQARHTSRGLRPPTEPRLRGRYVLWSAVSLVVVGVGTAAFSMGGGGSAAPGPKITPQLEMFSIEHAIQSGDIPLPEPTPAATAGP